MGTSQWSSRLRVYRSVLLQDDVLRHRLSAYIEATRIVSMHGLVSAAAEDWQRRDEAANALARWIALQFANTIDHDTVDLGGDALKLLEGLERLGAKVKRRRDAKVREFVRMSKAILDGEVPGTGQGRR